MASSTLRPRAAYPVNEEDRPEDDHAPFLRPKETDSQLDGGGDWGDESQLVPPGSED